MLLKVDIISATTSLESANKWAKRYKARIDKVAINKGDILDTLPASGF